MVSVEMLIFNEGRHMNGREGGKKRGVEYEDKEARQRLTLNLMSRLKCSEK